MRKIPTLFVRDPDDLKHVTEEVTPGCEWIFAGEGTATAKMNGTCCMVRDSQFYKRRELKPGKPIPNGFEEIEHDPATSKTVGWVLVDESDPTNKWHLKAFHEAVREGGDGTFELVGPKIQGNPHGFADHMLVRHGSQALGNIPLSYEGIKQYCLSSLGNWEGIVWHHSDGRMAKIKRRDFE